MYQSFIEIKTRLKALVPGACISIAGELYDQSVTRRIQTGLHIDIAVMESSQPVGDLGQ